MMSMDMGATCLDRETQSALPLWSKAVFVDWYGVLSHTPLWSSILEDHDHQHHNRLSVGVKGLFASSLLIDAWMRGARSSADVVPLLDLDFDRRHKPDFLLRRLHADCRLMEPDEQRLNALESLRPRILLAIATDNMDCVLEHALSRKRVRRRVDDVLCSSEMGVLKREDPVRFFGPWLMRHGLDFAEALLIDDAADNCAAFESAGGTALTVGEWSSTVASVERWAVIGS
jgi:FMN phosphatase YigB (HAD superfamily)